MEWLRKEPGRSIEQKFELRQSSSKLGAALAENLQLGGALAKKESQGGSLAPQEGEFPIKRDFWHGKEWNPSQIPEFEGQVSTPDLGTSLNSA